MSQAFDSSRTALVLGGAGFVGLATCRALSAAGFSPEIGDLTTVGTGLGFRCHRIDVTDRDAVRQAVDEIRPSVVVNLVSRLADATNRDPGSAFRVNVDGAQNVLEAVHEAGVDRYVFASSIAVYGDQADWGRRDVNEDSLGTPARLYGWHKLLHEVMIDEYRVAHGLDAVSLRISTVYGRERKAGLSAAVSHLIEPPPGAVAVDCPWGPDEAFSLIHVDDVGAALAGLASATSLRYPAYNSGGEHITVAGLIRHLVELRPALRVTCADPPATFAHCSRIDWSRLRELVDGHRESIFARMEAAAEATQRGAVTL
jgi:UDP-glucose 4-epimerase